MKNKNNTASPGQHIFRWVLRSVLTIYYGLLTLFKVIPQKKVPAQVRVLVTGTFYSDHWLITHLKPMANANNCDQLIMVSARPVPAMNNVQGAYAPWWLQKIAGQVGARLLYFSWLAIKERPDVLVGFHLLVNGLFVVFLARLIGAKSVYICGGGPIEVQGGGIKTENRIFNRIGQVDLFIEKLLLKSVNAMSLVVTMGTSAIEYFKEKGVTATCEIVPGGFDNDIFCPDVNVEKKYDLILIGRLSEVKRVDRFLHAIKLAKASRPDISAVIVGDGPDKLPLEKLAQELGLSEQVAFTGWQNNVAFWIKQSRCFVLTSDSEGLSQALIQAMMSGLPAITSNVGDLGDLLKNNVNGYLINILQPENFSTAFVELLSEKRVLGKFSVDAFESTKKFSVSEVELKWNNIFSTL
jgi:glycosyltransferase involved in cell wall biosynthesis